MWEKSSESWQKKRVLDSFKPQISEEIPNRVDNKYFLNNFAEGTQVQVYINGLLQSPTNYFIEQNHLFFIKLPHPDDEILVRYTQ